ncbi:class F sortase [Hamadaea sp.]|uniref:class F sortase n=1 Tax=Hamadaea sp. TaxID=2024425 RepID=UPI0025C54508|nr:class F sortase [Hamadaea sp.]
MRVKLPKFLGRLGKIRIPEPILITAGIAGIVLLGWATLGPEPPVSVTHGLIGGVQGADGGLDRSEPVKLAIPAISVDADVTPVGVDDAGEVQVPPLSAPMVVGWYNHGPAPGEVGAAVLLGHVDAAPAGPAVFYDLGRLPVGAEVTVDRADRRTAVFTVEAVRAYHKDAFPSGDIYGLARRAELRLVTCGGPFAGGEYQDNVVVFAVLTAVR